MSKPKSDTRYRLDVVKSEIAWTMPNLFKPSPFIEISLAGRQLYVTETKPSTPTPEWNEFLELNSDDPTSILSINLCRISKSVLGATKFIGSTQLSIEKLEKLGIISPDISLGLFDRNYKTAVAIVRFRKDEVHHTSNTDSKSRKKSSGAAPSIRDLQGENSRLKDELSDLQGKHLVKEKQLEERTRDLRVAQTFMATGDRYTGVDIMKMVKNLNDEIFQGAGLVSDLLGDGNAFEADERRKNGQLAQGDRDYLTQFIGPKLLEHLSSKSKHQVHPFPVQIAVQAILTRWCVFMVNSFYPGPAGNNLREIYRRIWESEPQAVAGRWRAMMAKQAKHLDSTTQKDEVIKILLNLLCLCGANVSTQQTRLHIHEVVSTILNMWMQLRTAIKEGVTTTEMEIFGANPNEVYQDEVMDVMYAGTKDVQQPDLGRDAGHILCAVGMGLHLIRRNSDGDGRMFIQRNTTVKAKVALPSVLSKFS